MMRRDNSDVEAEYDPISEAIVRYSRAFKYGAVEERQFGLEDARRVARNLIALSFESQQASLDERISDASSAAMHEAALGWEAIANLVSPPSLDALTNAAFAYELAGFQANAFSIAKTIQKTSSLPPILRLALYFLHRDFRELIKVGSAWSSDPASIPGDGDGRYRLTTVLYGQALARIAKSFLCGDLSQLAKAEADLQSAIKAATAFALVTEAPLIRATLSIVPSLRARSTWKLLAPYFDRDPRWRRYAKLLARGIQGSPGSSSRRAIVEFWPSQILAISSGLLDNSESRVVSMPTSAGKTRIAELVIANAVLSEDRCRCVYIAPFRALATEITSTLTPILSDLGIRVGSFVETSVDTSTLEESRIRTTSVLVATPEKLDLILRANPRFAEEVGLIIVDEGHVLGEGQRGLSFELSLARFMTRFPGARFIFLSAVVSDQTLADIASWMRVSEDAALTLPWRPTKQHLAELRWSGEKGQLHFLGSTGEASSLCKSVQYSIEGRTGKPLPRVFPDVTKRADVAASAAFHLAGSGPVMVYATQTNHVESIAESLAHRIDIERQIGVAVPSYFVSDPRLKSALIAQELFPKAVPWLRIGIAVHHGKVPDLLKQAIEDDFRAGRLRVLVATGTLAQGVNLPVRSVLFHSWSRFSEETGSQVEMSVREFWNVAGRAGRAGAETDALVAFLSMNTRDRNAFVRYSDQNNLESVKSMLLAQLQKLGDERLSATAELDSQILAMLAEEVHFGASQDLAGDVFAHSLASIQADRSKCDAEALKVTFRRITERVREKLVDVPSIAAFAETGLCTESCMVLRSFILANEEVVTKALLGDNIETLRWISAQLATVDIAELKENDTSYPTQDVLDAWLDGLPVDKIGGFIDCDDQSRSGLAKFIEEHISGRLSWVVNAFMRIACGEFGFETSDLSLTAQYLSAMVRFGLPSAHACWAMRNGVPLRAVASAIAGAFMNELQADAPATEEAFDEWYELLSAQDFIERFELPAEFLVDIRRGLYSALPAPVTRENATVESMLPMEVRLKLQPSVLRSLQVDQVLSVRRDFDNVLDRNAIVLEQGGVSLGAVTHRKAALLAPEIEAGAQMQATVVRRGATDIYALIEAAV